MHDKNMWIIQTLDDYFNTDRVSVSVTEVEAVREGHQSEVLLSLAEEFPADVCFTLVFRGRQGNLDLVAESPEEAKAWIQGVRKVIHKAQTMDAKERLDQYPLTVVHFRVWCSMTNKSNGTTDEKKQFR